MSLKHSLKHLLKNTILFFGIVIILVNSTYAMEYKWTSTIPVEFVPISSISNSNQLDNYLNNNNIVIFYIDKDYSMRYDDWILHKFNITENIPGKVPDYGNYTFVDANGVVVVFPKNCVYRDNNGALIYYTPMTQVNGDMPYKIQHITQNTENRYIPNYHDYEYINNGTFIIFPKKYITRNKDGVLLYNPAMLINDNATIYNVSTKLLDARNGIYEIKPKKILIIHPISTSDESLMDFVGWYVSQNNGTFAYINKVPPYYKHVLISGVAVQKIVPDEYGDYAIDVAGRKIKVDLRNEKLISNKLQSIKGISKLLNINITYITTGSEGINVVEKDGSIDPDELKELWNDYWFKKWYNENYTHISYCPYNIHSKYTSNMDILAMSYYPIIYVDKAPETFENDPVGGYYPDTIHYEGTQDYGYWESGTDSKNEYYHYDSGEPHWNSHENQTSNWYYEGKVGLPENDSEINDKYEYFNHWFIKNYAYALSKGVNGLLLTSSDKYLVDAIFGIDNENISWRLNINDKNLDYVVIPANRSIYLKNNITVLGVPGLTNNEVYGIHYIDEYYMPPKEENAGIYVADITKYDVDKLYDLKDNYTWICSFKNYAEWGSKYLTNNIRIVNGSNMVIKSNKGVKITIYRKNITLSDLSKLSYEEYDKNSNKVIIDNPPHNLKFSINQNN
jgi:hypothetical protein